MKGEVIGRQELRWQLEPAGGAGGPDRKASRQEGQMETAGELGVLR